MTHDLLEQRESIWNSIFNEICYIANFFLLDLLKCKSFLSYSYMYSINYKFIFDFEISREVLNEVFAPSKVLQM